jgi:hypothetical protein
MYYLFCQTECNCMLQLLLLLQYGGLNRTGCHRGVTVVFKWCDSGVIVVLQWSYRGVTEVLQ